MQGKGSEQGFVAHILSPQQKAFYGRPDPWKVDRKAGPYFNRPIGGLVPGEEIPGVVTKEDKAQEKKTIDPIQPATLVAPGEKCSRQVKNTGNQQYIRSQKMQVPN